MIKCLAIDDEPLALELLEDNIRQVPYLRLVATCRNPLEAMKVMEENEIDLLFLDIQMPGLTGIQFLQSLRKRPMAILITAYEKYALESYNLDVVDYLVKPVPMERFLKACNKAYELFQLRNRAANPAQKADHFFVPAEYSLLKVVFEDILYIEGLKDYIRIFLKSTQKPVVTRMSMKSVEEDLPVDEFLRIHKSYIISRKHISAVKKNSVFIGDIELPVGESYRDVIDALLGRKPEA